MTFPRQVGVARDRLRGQHAAGLNTNMLSWVPHAQVAALCAAPFLLDRPDIDSIFPKDAIARAKKILAAFKGGVGAYTDSRGNPLVREEVAKFFEKRDGVPSNSDVSAWLVDETEIHLNVPTDSPYGTIPL